MNAYFSGTLQDTILGFYNVMNGSAFANAKILALGIQPYINASIIIQLLTVAIPALERMAKDEGEEGKKKINTITRYATVALGLMLGEQKLTGIGAWRVHGGGFAGKTQAFVRKELADGYAMLMDSVFGEGACMVLNIREAGAIQIEL